jgi:hypothetical protein
MTIVPFTLLAIILDIILQIQSSKLEGISNLGIESMKLALKTTSILPDILESPITLDRSSSDSSQNPRKNFIGYPFGLGILFFCKECKTTYSSSLDTSSMKLTLSYLEKKLGK